MTPPEGFPEVEALLRLGAPIRWRLLQMPYTAVAEVGGWVFHIIDKYQRDSWAADPRVWMLYRLAEMIRGSAYGDRPPEYEIRHLVGSRLVHAPDLEDPT